MPGWDHAAIEESLRHALVDGLGLKPKTAFGPVRVAVTGRRVSPPLFESLELLGRDLSLARVAALGERLAGLTRFGRPRRDRVTSSALGSFRRPGLPGAPASHGVWGNWQPD